ncbi:hypothetical protein Pmani_011459 [Petrolisthes manimaculis]|uniref:Uncharacterized protein n=1 Tax=Petrolisthes manimaculis TaxID=1843537 RepID=A0AAE1PZI8_9EUCA|nr:hypothetical protein Pmani_011459 [Petrolisthes manimaculis]
MLVIHATGTYATHSTPRTTLNATPNATFNYSTPRSRKLHLLCSSASTYPTQRHACAPLHSPVRPRPLPRPRPAPLRQS